MASSHVTELADIGTVRVQKKRGVKRISMRIHNSGEVRVSQPFYLPYSAGIYFAKSHKEWIINQKQKTVELHIYDGMVIGKQHVLLIQPAAKIATRVANNTIVVSAPEVTIRSNAPEFTTAAKKAIKRALQKEAAVLLPNRLHTLATKYGYSYSDCKTKPMKSRWGSCSNTGVITLNCYLLMMPQEIIDYVIMHELSHTKQMNHSIAFWDEVASTTPLHKQFRAELKKIQPKIHAFYV